MASSSQKLSWTERRHCSCYLASGNQTQHSKLVCSGGSWSFQLLNLLYMSAKMCRNGCRKTELFWLILSQVQRGSGSQPKFIVHRSERSDKHKSRMGKLLKMLEGNSKSVFTCSAMFSLFHQVARRSRRLAASCKQKEGSQPNEPELKHRISAGHFKQPRVPQSALSCCLPKGFCHVTLWDALPWTQTDRKYKGTLLNILMPS